MVEEKTIWQNREKKTQQIKVESKKTEDSAADQEKTLAALGVEPNVVKKVRRVVEPQTKHAPQPKNTPTRALIFRFLGNFLILISIAGLAYTLYPVAKVEISYKINKFLGKTFKVESQQPQGTTFGDLLGRPAPVILTPKSTDFGIVVEKIGANTQVLANVNAADQREYNRELQKGVAHAKGTAFPGEAGLSFLFAHSVLNPWDVPRYNAVFYLLKELEAGDRIVVFWQGRRYDYITFDKKIVGPTDVQFLYQNYSEPILVLQTCDPPGTTWRRLLIFARLAAAT